MGARKLAGLALTWVPAVVVVVVLLLATKDLPSPLPTHWNVRGDVNGTMSRMAFTVMSVGITVVAALLAAGVYRVHEDETVRRDAATACAFAAYLIGGLSVMTILLARGARTASEVDLLWWAVLVALAVGFAVPACVTTLRARGFVALGIGCAVIGVLLIITADLAGAAMIAVTVAVQATVDDIRPLAWGRLGVPRPPRPPCPRPACRSGPGARPAQRQQGRRHRRRPRTPRRPRQRPAHPPAPGLRAACGQSHRGCRAQHLGWWAT